MRVRVVLSIRHRYHLGLRCGTAKLKHSEVVGERTVRVDGEDTSGTAVVVCDEEEVRAGTVPTRQLTGPSPPVGRARVVAGGRIVPEEGSKVCEKTRPGEDSSTLYRSVTAYNLSPSRGRVEKAIHEGDVPEEFGLTLARFALACPACRESRGRWYRRIPLRRVSLCDRDGGVCGRVETATSEAARIGPQRAAAEKTGSALSSGAYTLIEGGKKLQLTSLPK